MSTCELLLTLTLVSGVVLLHRQGAWELEKLGLSRVVSPSALHGLWSQDGFLMSFFLFVVSLSVSFPSTAVAPFAESEGFPGTDAALACMPPCFSFPCGTLPKKDYGAPKMLLYNICTQ